MKTSKSKTIRRNKAEQALRDMYERHRGKLPEYSWESEHERWGEFVVTLLGVIFTADAAWSRQAADLLQAQRLLSPQSLAILGRADRTLLERGFVRQGATASQSRKAVALLSATARSVIEQWDGYIQRMLRSHAKLMALDVRRLLVGANLSEKEAGRISTTWLQNVAAMPILLTSDPHVQAFCKRYALTGDELTDLSDAAGLNLAVLDDLLAMEHREKGRNARPRTRARTEVHAEAKLA